MNDRFAELPKPPYYVVIFANQLSETPEGYSDMLAELEDIAKSMPGYIGRETARDATGFGMAISYWTDEDAVKNWKAQADHFGAQQMGKRQWYDHYVLRIAKVERHYEGPKGRTAP